MSFEKKNFFVIGSIDFLEEKNENAMDNLVFYPY